MREHGEEMEVSVARIAQAMKYRRHMQVEPTTLVSSENWL